MSGILFDTSVYISALRQGDEATLSLRRATRASDEKTRPLWLSAVVLHELFVGAESARARRELQRLEREFVKVDRLLIPTRADNTSSRKKVFSQDRARMSRSPLSVNRHLAHQ